MNTKHTDSYQLVTDRIIAKLEAGTIPWKHFASSPLAEPKNLVSKKPYRGINHFLLSGTKYGSEFWLTYKQAEELGGHVKKGEHSTPVVFWKFIKVEDKDARDGEVSSKAKEIPFLRYYSVFNVEQCEGIDYKKLEGGASRDSDPIEEAESIITGMPNPPHIEIDKTPKAYYAPASDFLHMTQRSACVSDSAYYDTFLHELVHSTGHKSRLDRMDGDRAWHRFGSKPYANEELVAEMGAAMLCSQAGIFQEVEDNTAAYVANWLTKLENDKTLVVHAAAKAQKACDWILNTSYTEDSK